MAITIPITKTRSLTVRLPRSYRGTALLPNATLTLAIGLLLYTVWLLFTNVATPMIAPEPLKPEEITAERAEIDQTTLNAILLENKKKQETIPLGNIRDPFRPRVDTKATVPLE